MKNISKIALIALCLCVSQMLNAATWQKAGSVPKSATAGAACSIAGAIATDAAGTGALLTCQSGVWTNSSTIGANQVWTDMTASRAFGVLYRNTTGRPITVTVNGHCSTPGYPVGTNMDLYVNGMMISRGAVLTGGSSAFSNHVTAVVPNGATYQVLTGQGPVTMEYWRELR